MGGYGMNIEQITTFLSVYQSGSYKMAAELLYLPQPTVTHRINQLEKELGKTLLIRGKGKVALTEEGKAFLPHARNVLGALQEGKEAVERVRSGAGGKLSIGCNNSFAAYVLPEVMSSFSELYPSVSMKVYCYSSLELVRLMKNQQFQLGITRYRSNDSGIVYRPVFSEEMMLYVSPSHKFASEKSLPLQTILKEPLVSYPKDTQYRKMLDATVSQYDVNYQVKVETNNLQLIKHFVRTNAGVFLSGGVYMQKEIREKELVQIKIEHNPFPLSQVFVVHKESELNSLDSLFIRHFENALNVRLRSALSRNEAYG
jgi:DNA-binding transcriptional LysR family regulator